MTEPGVPMEPGVPVLGPADAEMYGWQFGPDSKGNLWLRVIDGRGAICLPPGTNIMHTSGGNMTMSPTVQVTDLVGSVDADGHAWLSDGVEVTGTSVTPTRNVHAIIFAPGGFLRWERGKLLYQGIEFAGVLKPARAEPSKDPSEPLETLEASQARCEISRASRSSQPFTWPQGRTDLSGPVRLK